MQPLCKQCTRVDKSRMLLTVWTTRFLIGRINARHEYDDITTGDDVRFVKKTECSFEGIT